MRLRQRAERDKARRYPQSSCSKTRDCCGGTSRGMRPSTMIKRMLAGFAVASCACTSTYHPEYHPVTVTEVHQSVSASGVAHTPVANGGVTPLVIQQPAL